MCRSLASREYSSPGGLGLRKLMITSVMSMPALVYYTHDSSSIHPVQPDSAIWIYQFSKARSSSSESKIFGVVS